MARDPSALLKKQSCSCPKKIESSSVSLNLRFNSMHRPASGFNNLSPFHLTSFPLLNVTGYAAGAKKSLWIEYSKYFIYVFSNLASATKLGLLFATNILSSR